MKVAEGAIQIDYPDARLGTAPAEVTINTPLWTRPFNDTVFVINPDRAAMFVKEYVAYAGQFDNPHIPNDELITSALLHTLDDIDHPFEAPPNSISMDRGDVEIRSILKLQIPSNEMGYRVTTMLIAQIDNAAAIEGAKQHVRMVGRVVATVRFDLRVVCANAGGSIDRRGQNAGRSRYRRALQSPAGVYQVGYQPPHASKPKF